MLEKLLTIAGKLVLSLLFLGFFFTIGHDMLESIWGLFTAFEDVPDFYAVGWTMIFWAVVAALPVVPAYLMARLIR